MGNWIELHQNEQPFLVNLDNIFIIVRSKDGLKASLLYKDGANTICDETYDQIKKLLPYLVP